jgi:hypothetical protein
LTGLGLWGTDGLDRQRSRCSLEWLEQARKDLGEDTKGLPDTPPVRDLLDIKKVLKAEYAFA